LTRCERLLQRMIDSPVTNQVASASLYNSHGRAILPVRMD